MLYAPFYNHHREIADRETAIIKVTPDHPSLPVDDYWFVECYCTDPKCDCRRVRLIVTPLSQPENPAAVLAWGWASKEYYRKWMGGDNEYALQTTRGDLEPMMPQSSHAEEFLRMFQDRLAEDPNFGRQFERHYVMFKCGIAEAAATAGGAPMTRQQRRAAERAVRKGGAARQGLI